MKDSWWNHVHSVPNKMKVMIARNCQVPWIVLVILTASLLLTSWCSPPVIKRQVLMAVAMITMQVTREKRDGGGNAVASTAGNWQICFNGTVSAGLWFYCSYSFQLKPTAFFSMRHSSSMRVRTSWHHVDQ